MTKAKLPVNNLVPSVTKNGPEKQTNSKFLSLTL